MDKFEENIHKFDEFNSIKLKNIEEISPNTYKLIIQILPFLLHTNQNELPGFISGAPCGICNYTVNNDMQKILRSEFKEVKSLRFSSTSENKIEFLSLIGSVGTVAQTGKSDFDFWVGIKKHDLTGKETGAFQRKLQLLENWFLEKKMEVHFFVQDSSSLRRNVFCSAGEDRSGAAQGVLLKDEYFRSSIHIAGKIPLWWIIEPDVPEEEYNKQSADLGKNKEMSEKIIDIGNITNIRKTSFLAGALWQLVKALTYPYKSFIKMALIEKYLFSDDSENVTLLSNKLKKNIFNGKLDDDSIDSYLLMYFTVEDYFKSGNKTAIDMLRKCFYLKSKPGLTSMIGPEPEMSRKQIVFDVFVKEWKWDKEKIQYLDGFDKWPLTDILTFDKQLKDFNFVIAESSKKNQAGLVLPDGFTLEKTAVASLFAQGFLATLVDSNSNRQITNPFFWPAIFLIIFLIVAAVLGEKSTKRRFLPFASVQVGMDLHLWRRAFT